MKWGGKPGERVGRINDRRTGGRRDEGDISCYTRQTREAGR